MKYVYLFLFFFPITAISQIVNIPDPNFKNLLLEYYQPIIDTNGDGEIQVSEAQVITTLFVYGSDDPFDLTGISAFTNLTSLTIIGVNGLDADLSGLANLTDLDIGSCHINTLSLNGLDNLMMLGISGSDLAELTLPSLPELGDLNIQSMPNLTSLTITSAPQLSNIYLVGLHLLDSVDSVVLPSLKIIGIDQSGISSVDFSKFPNIEDARFSSCEISTLTASNLPSLQVLYCSGGPLTSVSVSECNSLADLSLNDGNLTSLALNDLPSLEILSANDNQIADLELENLPALQRLHLNQNQLQSLDLDFAPNLTEVYCSSNQITSFAPVGSHIERITCSENNMSSIDLSNAPNLLALDISNNNLQTLDVSSTHDLTSLYAQQNQLQSLDLSQIPSLVYLFCDQNQISELSLDQVPLLQGFGGSSNLFTSLDFSSQTSASELLYVYVESNPNLQSLIIKNQRGEDLFVSDCPNLAFLCIDEEDLDDLMSGMAWTTITSQNISVNSYCNFTPGGQFNIINGNIAFDADNNGCDASDATYADMKVTLTDADGVSGSTFTDADGHFSFYAQTGTFTVSTELDPTVFSATPQTVIFNDAGQNAETVDFCVTALGTQYLAEISIVPVDAARPGFDAHYKIVYKNIGNQTLNGEISFQFDEAVVDFVSSAILPTAQTSGNLSWSYADLLPFESREILLTLNLNSPLENPSVNNGDILSFHTVVSSVTEPGQPLVSSGFTLSQTVVGSFDPNDKTCLEGENISQQMLGDYLHYLIRFQNSGTYLAENVVVKDMIDTSKLDIATLELTDSSHPHITRITDNKVEFIFEGINLPAEQDDEPGSHGYVAFKIKTKSNLAIGDAVSNIADIFFDYNLPITTEPAITTVSNLGFGEVGDMSIHTYPNPTRNLVFVSADSEIRSIQLYDIQGRLLQTKTVDIKNAAIDLSSNADGVYFAKIRTDKGSKTEKLLKE
ncbi:leucine-rich repeat domain-containing protein [Flavobacterium sp. MAH-1]|uniref:Leucine-rich repeat domain-containing protein n=1 Tax=Flavobacterium agri TaxID=2743471 RepID=A0A7Y8Y649_9FLAO|nr:T9SS type A sorting domain-containing protein [Flavobacterium agri]NUY82605.1 leucine-rich repeat domain-containing protein [Flavobacterium agri]NYA72628.1 leucine-rich repeat domain-containing protein [Flavobacterium agri]